MLTRISRKKSLFAVNVQLLQLEEELKTVRSMELTLLSSNANSVVQLPNGSVGVILIFANHATKNNAVEITCQENQKTNCQNVQERLSVH